MNKTDYPLPPARSFLTLIPPATEMVERVDENLTMSSLEIATLTGKRHNHVMRDIRIMLNALADVDAGVDGGVPKFGDTPGGGLSKFGQTPSFVSNYTDPQNGQTYPVYNLPKDLTLTLVSGYDIPMRHKIVKRWLEIEGRGAGSQPQLAEPGPKRRGRPPGSGKSNLAASLTVHADGSVHLDVTGANAADLIEMARALRN